jgi:hypothetical protein
LSSRASRPPRIGPSDQATRHGRGDRSDLRRAAPWTGGPVRRGAVGSTPRAG